jgi:hypothetical protein
VTAEQLARWRAVSLGLVNSPSIGRSIRKRVRGHVAAIIDIAVWDGLKENPGCLDDWDQGPVYLCDVVSDYLWENGLEDERGEYPSRTGAAVTACVRAGIDLASKPSAGVVGWFTVGDLRRVTGKPLPEWVQAFFEKPITPRVRDDAGVWL